MKVKRWLRRLAIRQAIRLVDAIETPCFNFQTSLRGRLAPDTIEPAPVSDFVLAWRVTRYLILFVGIVAIIAFFATLRTFYFAGFALAVVAGWSAIFALVRRIAHRKSLAVAWDITWDNATPPPARVVCALPRRRETLPDTERDQNTARDRISDGTAGETDTADQSPRRESFEEFEARRAGLRKPTSARRRRGISSADFNRRLAREMETVFEGSR